MDEERLNEAVEKAKGAFWNSIAESYPEITTGDIEPMDSFIFGQTCKGIVKSWIILNKNNEEE